MPQDYFPPLPEGILGDAPVTSGKFYNIEVYGNINAEGGTFTNVNITGILNAEAGSDVDWSYISNVSINNADIVSLSFDKITAATNTASLTIGSSGYIQSSGYVAPSGSTPGTGFRINGDGSAVFSDVDVYGTIYATSGEIGGLDIVNQIELASGGYILGGTGGADSTLIAPSATGLQIVGSGLAGQALDVNDLPDGIDIRPVSGAVPQTTALTVANISTELLEITGGGLVLAADGSTSNPSFSFFTDPDTGIYSSSTNAMGFVAGGGVEFTLGDGYLQGRDSAQSVYIRSVTGSVSAPQYSFRSDGDTGMYWYGTDQVALTAGGAVQMVTGNAANPSIRLVDGNATAPAMRFINDGDTGIYSSGTNRISIACGGNEELALSTTGFLVPNVYSATTGSAANVFVDSAGQLFRRTSARKYKEDIEFAPWLTDIKLRPVRYKRINEPQYYYGFIADELAEEDELLALYNDDGGVEDYDTRAVLAVLAAKIERLEEQMKGCTCHDV